MLTKWLKKKLDGDYKRMLWAILNKSWRRNTQQSRSCTATYHPSRKLSQLDESDCRRSRGELISDVLLWTPLNGQAKAGQLAQTYILHLCEDTGCSPEDLPEAMNDREGWWDRIKDIRADGTRRWWYFALVNSIPSSLILITIVL